MLPNPHDIIGLVLPLATDAVLHLWCRICNRIFHKQQKDFTGFGMRLSSPEGNIGLWAPQIRHSQESSISRTILLVETS